TDLGAIDALDREEDHGRSGLGELRRHRCEDLFAVYGITLPVTHLNKRQAAIQKARALLAFDDLAERLLVIADLKQHRRAGLKPHRWLIGPEIDAPAIADHAHLLLVPRGAQHDRVVTEVGVYPTQRREQRFEKLISRSARLPHGRLG